MLKKVKKAAMSQAMKLMSNPKVGKLLSDPRVMNAITKGFEVHGQIRNSVEGKLRTLADSLNLVSKEELSNITSKLNQVESSVGDLVAKVEEVAKKRVVRKKKKAGKPVRPGDIAKMIGEESKSVSKVISDLKKKGKVTSPKRCYYSLGD